MSKQQQKPYVLLVEDDIISAKIAQELLTQEGCRVDWVQTAQDAINLPKQKYSFILMDLHLPDSDGYAITKHIRQNNHDNQTIPIIALTASATFENQRHAQAIGMNAFLSKPLTKDHCHWIVCHFAQAKQPAARVNNQGGL